MKILNYGSCNTLSIISGPTTDSNRRNAFFNIDSLQSKNCGQIRTATHLSKPFKKPSHSKIIYKAIDATVFWTDLNYHTTPPAENKVNLKKMQFQFG